MDILSDLQIHSRFSRAVSKHMTLPNIATWARRKGIGLVATGDWTHPMWFREIERDLEETGTGLLRLKKEVVSSWFSRLNEHAEIPDASVTGRTGFSAIDPKELPLFLLATEVSCIYSQGGRVRRVHTLIWVPTLESARKISQEMTKRGCNLMSDGRPIVGLTSIQIAELVFSAEPKALIIPAHAWTPWFSVYGSLGGFDSVKEAFGIYADRIYAVETGLSSNPSMNWRIEELDRRALVSFSDAHSGPKLGREATLFRIPGELTYDALSDAVRHGAVVPQKGKAGIAYTIEFYPEEGKYHYTGHRNCKIRQTPEETRTKGTSCPVCGKALTVGVMHRIDALAARSDTEVGIRPVPSPDPAIQAVCYGSSAYPNRPPFFMLVPLLEVIAESLSTSTASRKAQSVYFRLTDEVGPEFDVLLRSDLSSIARAAGDRVSQGIERVRNGALHIDPGYDGVFGVVKIWDDESEGIADTDKEQLSLLS